MIYPILLAMITLDNHPIFFSIPSTTLSLSFTRIRYESIVLSSSISLLVAISFQPPIFSISRYYSKCLEELHLSFLQTLLIIQIENEAPFNDVPIGTESGQFHFSAGRLNDLVLWKEQQQQHDNTVSFSLTYIV